MPRFLKQKIRKRRSMGFQSVAKRKRILFKKAKSDSGVTGLEPATYDVTDHRAHLLRYTPFENV
jgi:hypothetical protein